jgi:DNA-binding XRE family transcriptional regulator
MANFGHLYGSCSHSALPTACVAVSHAVQTTLTETQSRDNSETAAVRLLSGAGVTTIEYPLSSGSLGGDREGTRGMTMPGKRLGLIAARKTAGLSQECLAEHMDVDRSTVQRWESGQSTPQPCHRPKLARVLASRMIN